MLVSHDMRRVRKNNDHCTILLTGGPPHQESITSASPNTPDYPQGQSQAILVKKLQGEHVFWVQHDSIQWGLTIVIHLSTYSTDSNQPLHALPSLVTPLETSSCTAVHYSLFTSSFNASEPWHMEREERQWANCTILTGWPPHQENTTSTCPNPPDYPQGRS